MPFILYAALPVIGTTTDSVDNIGVCQSNDNFFANNIDCVSEPNMVLHVEATIGMSAYQSHIASPTPHYSMLGLAMQELILMVKLCHIIRCYRL